MNRDQIATANTLFFKRDQVQRRLDTVLSGSGVALAITGDYQTPEVLAAVVTPLADHFRSEIASIDDQLRLLGWTDE
ncbi:hypothetical protein [Pseudomonas putida]|uniref:Uncharacterized protein n=1 Tax=Pseudomonas putida TaxID=303 RepID=A0A8I1EGS9_PSEPU|nr:hypothetical protein [Pseudomonas putida]MBI6886470.1 hypothetical protein [Pseudomonas putida]